ncbi:MAG: hypothetical protein M0R22_00160 [Dehalococcoidia bacterium]|jgi:hypothetical protein|nr:hypothetical protein [Dehalococcoidia bacterium]
MSHRSRHKQQRAIPMKELARLRRDKVPDEAIELAYAAPLEPFSREPLPLAPMARVHRPSWFVDFWARVWAFLVGWLYSGGGR